MSGDGMPSAIEMASTVALLELVVDHENGLATMLYIAHRGEMVAVRVFVARALVALQLAVSRGSSSH